MRMPLVVEIPFYHRVTLSQPHFALSGCLVFRKKVVFQVVSDLGDPCIGTPLRNWVWLLEVFETLEGAHNPWRTPQMEHRRDRFAQFGRLGGWLQQLSLEDALWHGCLS
jgi:hypothetical protein